MWKYNKNYHLKVKALSYLPLLILFFLAIFALRTFWGPEYFDGHDSLAHLVRLYQYDLALKDGQILPQWAGSLLAGRGYPVFIFAYPLPYLIAEGFHLAGFSLAVAIKLTFVLAYLVSAITMYFLALNLWKSRLAGFTAALLWSWAPPIFEKIFIGAALGEVVAYGFIPLTFLAIFKLIQKPSFKLAILLSLFTSAWILSHLLNPIIFSPLLVIFIFSRLIRSKTKTLCLKYLFLSGLITLGLSAWFLFPAATEVKFTHYHEFVLSQYADQFVSFSRLLYSTWGTDAPGWGNNPVSQQVGLAQWLGIAIALLFFFRKATPFLLGFGLSIFLMLSISKPVWDLPTLLQNVSTPWRFLSLAVFSATLAGSGALQQIKNSWLRIGLFLCLIFLALYGNRNHLRINEKRNYDLNFLQSYTGVATGWNEHLPIWVKDTPHQFPLNKLEVLSGDCQIQVGEIKSNLQQFQLNCSQDSVIQLNTAYYPGWKIKHNQKIISIKPGVNGMISFTVPAGDGLLVARFSSTPLRLISKLISLFTLLFILLYYFRNRLNHIFKIFLVHMRIKR